MKILSLDSSTKNFSLAVSEDKKILTSRNIRLNKVLESSIIPGIQKILQKAGVSLHELDGFAVGLGPGSFTSLRVGLSTIKALAFAGEKKVVGVSSLDVLAMNAPKDTCRICAIMDAKRKSFFAAFYQREHGGALRRDSEYLLTSFEEIEKRAVEKTYFVGDGVFLLPDQFRQKNPRHFIFAPEKLWFPQAKHLALLAYPRFLEKKFDDPETIVPLYLYPEDCQVQK